MTLNKGDWAILVGSGRVYQIVDERQVRPDGVGLIYEELVKFVDDPRHPVWIEHQPLANSSRRLTDSERTRHVETIGRWSAVLAEKKAAATACMMQWFGPEKPLVVIDKPRVWDYPVGMHRYEGAALKPDAFKNGVDFSRPPKG